ncbi:alginate lyase family protein, partial [Pontiella sp.]|uniref:alginate lyase family protein n=1 Tax=Pontiella sp. TaxID=2837462 RepID=UPI0035669784
MNVRWSAISILAALSACTVQAVVVNVDIDARTSDANASRQGILFSGQGAYADVGNDYWNSISTDERAISSLIASDGSTVSSVGISVSGGDGYVHTGITNYLLADYFYGSTTTTLTGLEPGGAYTLYVYAVGDQSGQGSTVTIGSDVQVTTGDNSGVYALGGNYVVFAANADPSGEMVISSSDKLTGLQLVGDTPEPVYNLVHPGMSHKQSDLDRMKYQVAARVEPWYSSYQEMCQDSKADYNYAVQGSSTNRVIYRDAPRTNKSAFESDSRAAYYNAIRWVVEGDTRYANKAVEIFNAWTGIRYVQHSGTTTLSGSMIYIMLEAAEMVKSTYSGWSAADRQAFGDMLVYPGWSGTTVPPNLDSAYEDGGEGSWYWRVYKGDRARAGNQELSGWRACMAIGIFLDNEIIYDRAMRYVAGMDHRTDDLAYEPGPNIAVNAFTTTPYNVSYTHEQQDSIPDYGYDGVLTNYVYETGQCAEAARDQGHASWGLNCLESLAEMAWNQGDDLWGLEDSRLLLGLEYHTRYNLSYLQTFSDQPTPWEPTVESGEFVSRLNRVARSKCLAINPYFEYDFTSVSRGAVDRAQWELPIAHYVGRGFVSSTNEARWITRTRDYNIAQDGYEETD